VALGHVHLALGDRDATVEQMVLALEAKPDCQPALDAMEKLGVLVAIYENPRDAASLTYVRADSVLAYLGEQWKSEPRDAAFYLEQLAYHERERRFAVALAAAEAALAAGPDAAGSDRAESARVSALRALGRAEEALTAARAFAAKSPRSAAARIELSRCLAAAGKADEAALEVEAALEAEPGDQAALVARFWPADATDILQVNAAIPGLRAFAEAHADVAGTWRSLARAELVVGRHDDALVDFARACELAPDDDDLRAEYWAELGKLQRYQEILNDAARVADIGKRDWKLRWNEAEAYAGLGRKIEARAAFSAINFDQSLHVDVRKRAKRAVKSIDEGTPG
jgi:tetratricopeptide (TPR) repeat protein